jgi:PKD repeat protein
MRSSVFTRRLVAVVTAALCAVLAVQIPADAFGVPQSTPVGVTPSRATPNMLDGAVFTITKVGDTVIAGGSFTQVAPPGSTTAISDPDNGKYIVAFDAATGAVNTNFEPGLDGAVNSVLPGPTPNTVYVGGNFNNVGGAKAKGVVLLDLATGKRVTTFRTSPMNGVVETLRRIDNRLFVGGTFTTFQGQARGGLASVDATTGVVDSFVQTTVLTNHNWTPGSTGIAKAAVGVFGMDISPDGSRMVIIGNFKTVDALPRDQIAMLDLTGGQAVVRTDWQTHGYEAPCYSWAYDSYIRDVQFSPDGTYFVVAATGGGINTLCDAASRFETGGSGTNIQPTWVDHAGGDTFLSVAITGTAVYVGGHERWMNNPLGNDSPGAGAVPRPGMGALDPATGVPLSWNPGRNPRGAGAYAMFATPDGLYVGSDTDWIGDHKYRRMKLAYFPLAEGTPLASSATPGLPGTVYLAGTPAPKVDPATVLYRIDAGGPTVNATDGGPNWASDSGTTSPYRNSGSNTASYNQATGFDATIPDGTPASLFASERWDPADNNEMHWAFPVTPGQKVTVRLYFANECTCTATAGQRQFDVYLDNAKVLDHFDPVAATGRTQTATMRSFDITSDGRVDIVFGHEVENPLVNAIEIVKTPASTTTTTTGGLVSRTFDGTTAGPAQTVSADTDWNAVRAPVLIGSELYYGKSDGLLYRRAFDGQTFGAEELVDPYNDPAWSAIDTGSGQTFQGTRPNFYGELARVTAMFFSDGRLYYTVAGSSSLYYRAFSPDSGVVYPVESAVPGVSLPQLNGAFLGGGKLWIVDSSTGALEWLAFTPGTATGPASVTGTPTVVSSPTVGGVDWRARSVFLGAGASPNVAPVASLVPSCTGLDCSFDGSGSVDPDGSIVAWSWTFGDGATATGASAMHSYTAAGTYPVTLTVTDDKGATTTASRSVSVAPVANKAPTAAATASCDVFVCSFDATGSVDPDGQIASYAWDFGDGSSGTGVTASHTYPRSGSFTATLTVTDDAGATAEQQLSVSPSAPVVSGVAFRGVSTLDVNGTEATVQVPDSVEPGDLLLLQVASAGSATQTVPTGWTQVASVAPTGALTTVWQRAAVAGDAGSSLTVSFGSRQKADVAVLAYSGARVDPNGVATGTDATSAGDHTQPSVTAADAGSRVLWLWNVKSSSTSTLSLPAGTVSRGAFSGSGTGYVTTLAAESAQPVSGTVAGPTSTADGSTTVGRTTMVALVLAPAGAVANQAPIAVATVSCQGMACSFDASGSSDPDGQLAGYAWDFGDGTTGSGISASHTYGTAGNYGVTLTVTDGQGAHGSQQVTVSPSVPSATAVSFRGASGVDVNATGATVPVPDSVQPGDLLVLSIASAGTATHTPPDGWTPVTSVTPTGATTTVWQRTAVAGDAGSSVTVTFSTRQKADVTVLAYSSAQVDPAGVATATDNYAAGDHTQPVVTASQPGSRVVWLWNVKSSATTALSLPDGTVSRSSFTGSGTGYVTTLAAESGQTVSGDVAGPTSTADGVTMGRTTMVALVLAPKA